jgi:predicted MFS family arabinose efflux permease
MGRLLAGMQIARIAQSMVSITIVLFALEAYGSPILSGIASFFSIFPGLLLSPIAGALLDRHGRTRLVALDYLMALAALAAIGILALAGNLPGWLLVTIAGIASLTAPLSSTGLRSLFPLIVPSHLWERVNAVDSTGYVVATLVGPPVAAALVAAWGGAVTFIVIGLSYGIAAIVIARAPEPPGNIVSTGQLTADAWQGLMYTWRNRTLRGLGFSISSLNLANGTITIVVPLLVLQRFHFGEAIVGLVIAVQGLAGVISAFAFGRMDSRDRERIMLALPMALTGVALLLLLSKASIVNVGIVMMITGVLNGPIDIALFTLRQRRTDPNWTGRAFAVSMAFNYAGTPIGSAVAGIIAARSLDAAIMFSIIASLISVVFVVAMIPSSE